ncbi:D-glucuronyl C5-epimerase [Thermococcus sp. LS1]|nr:D-glucuronyl C5-epimerase [Thermococcus sp. LS1]
MSGMKRNVAALVVAFILIVSIAGFVYRGSPAETDSTGTQSTKNEGDIRIYAMIENENAAFEMALFNIEIGDAKINETNVPMLAYTGAPGRVVFKIKGWAINWNGVEFDVSGKVTVSTEAGKTYLITLEPVHEPGIFVMRLDEKLSGVIGRDVPTTIFLEDSTAVGDTLARAGFPSELTVNKELREKYLNLWKETGNLSYLQAYRDLSYHIKTLGLMAKLGNVDGPAVRTLVLGLRATDYYYSHWSEPGRKDMILVFFNDSPYYGALKVADGPMCSRLPFIYYTARGFNLYPVSALHWAEIYYERGDYEAMLEILDELLPFATYGRYSGTEYAVFHIYFHFQNASIPWVSGYAQGMAAGLYALAYNLTENETYLETAKLFLNSFDLPLSQNGFVVQTKYGPWYLEYNYYPEQLVLNGHIIALQGLYHYWKVTGDERAYNLFWEGAMSVKKALPDFDTGDWSRYASIYDSSSEFYHRLHIKLLVWLYMKTGDETFLEYAEKWDEYLKERGLELENIPRLLKEMGK